MSFLPHIATEQIEQLPLADFKGNIIVVENLGKEYRDAVEALNKEKVIGFDTETKPSFRKGQVHKVALLQVATEDTCFLFRLKHTGLTPAIVRLLEDTTTTKVGLSWHDDLHSLHALGDFTPGTFIELQKLVNELGIEDMSLQKLYANIFGQKISKREQLSNWEADILTDKQKMYAATDAWACVKLYQEVTRLKENHEYELIIQKEEETEK